MIIIIIINLICKIEKIKNLGFSSARDVWNTVTGLTNAKMKWLMFTGLQEPCNTSLNLFSYNYFREP
jgi:hypothetical protein